MAGRQSRQGRSWSAGAGPMAIRSPTVNRKRRRVEFWEILYSFLRIAPKFRSIFDPVGLSIFDFLAGFGPFRAIPRPDSDSGRSDLRFEHVRPQKIMKYAISWIFQILKK